MQRATRRRWSGTLLGLSAATAVLGVHIGPAQAESTVATVSGPLNVRTGPTTAADKVDRIPDRATVTIVCQVSGQWIGGDVRGSAQWDRLDNGRYVSHAYVQTSATIPACDAPTPAPADPQPPATPESPAADPGRGIAATVSTGDIPLNIRSAPTSGSARVGTYNDRSPISVICQVGGQWVNGKVRATAQWDSLAGGTYVSDAYVERSGTPPACTSGTPVTPTPGPISGGSNAQFIAAAVPAAQHNQREYLVPASVTIAQAIIESGWGRSTLASKDNNYFGIKCFKGLAGSIATGCHDYRTYECEPTCAPATASFRVYASIDDSFRDHGSFLTTNSRYAPAFVTPHDANLFLWQIWKAGYATSPTYYTDVANLMVKYNLYQYDVA